MWAILFYSIIFLVAGFIQESLFCFYHRAREDNRILISSALSGITTIITLLVISKIIYQMSNTGFWFLGYVVVFAVGKCIGTYTSLTLWNKLYPSERD